MTLRGVVSVVVLVMIWGLAGCDTGGSSASQPMETPAAVSTVAEQGTPAAPPVVDASPGDAHADLRQLAVAITKHVRDQEWEAVRPFVPDDIAALEDSFLHRALAGALVPEGIGTDESDWDVEEHEGWTTVRLIGLPFVAMIFRGQDDGTYVLDPGPHSLQHVARYAEDATPEATARPDGGFQPRLVTERDEDIQPIGRHFQQDFRAVSANDESVTLTVTWGFMRGASGLLPLNGLTWRSADAEGPVDVIWTSAVLTDDALEFPVPTWEGDAARLRPDDPSEGNLIGYTISLSMIGAPADKELHLLVDDMVLALPSGEEITFGIDHHLSVDLLVGDSAMTLVRS